jgi:phage terminase small subunit
VAETTKSRKRTKLTPKQAKFVKAKIEGKSGVQAALEAYDTTDINTANQIAIDNLQKPTIKNAIDAAYTRQGITADSISRVLYEAMTATKTISRRVYNSDDDDDGVPVEVVQEVADHSTRINAVRTAAQLIGLGSKDSDGNAGTTVNFNFGSKKYN